MYWGLEIVPKSKAQTSRIGHLSMSMPLVMTQK